MKQDYDYKKIEQVHETLKDKGYHHIDTYKLLNPCSDRIEMWLGHGENILLEVFHDGYCGIYKDTNEI